MRRLFLLLAVLLLAAPAARAQTLGAAVRAGAQGFDAGGALALGSSVAVRGSASFLAYGSDGVDVLDDTEVRWNADGDLLFANALVDFHPFGNAFRLTAGAVYNGSEISGSFSPTENVEAGGRSYTPAEVGDVAMTVTFDRTVAPYVGLGAGRAVPRRVSFLFDVGAIYQGAPSVDLAASGMLTPTEGEAAQIEENLSWAEWYPVVSLGFAVRLF